ncbi:N-acetyltransferase [Actinomadura sp. KC345]|nr:N-acetyltransferase [Actinomadura sp. KC345]
MVLRRWEAGDREPFAALNADPEVMAHFPAPLTRAESDAMVDGIEARFEGEGFGFWALETADTNRFIGFTGLAVVRFDAPFTPAVEIGWRLARSAWGHGYAAEAARRALRFAFDDARLDEVVSFTSTANLRSQAVMERIGMVRDAAGDFDHPLVDDGHRLKRHVLWRITAAAWHGDHRRTARMESR